jgi:hypothetical protein
MNVRITEYHTLEHRLVVSLMEPHHPVILGVIRSILPRFAGDTHVVRVEPSLGAVVVDHLLPSKLLSMR